MARSELPSSARCGAVALALGLLSACSGESGRFFIVQDQVPKAGCVIDTNRSIYQGQGLLDLALVNGDTAFAYQLFPLIQNDYPSSGGAGAPEPNRLFVRAFRVRVEAPDPTSTATKKVFDYVTGLTNATDATHSLVEFQVPWAGTIDPGGGLLAAAVGVIPGELARNLRNMGVTSTGPVDLTVHVRAVGKSQVSEVESQEFVFPIQVCQNCLISSVRDCPATAANTGNACNVAQDQVVDCCQSGSALTCPAVGASK